MKIVPIVSASVLAGAIILSVIVLSPTASKEDISAGSQVVRTTPTVTPTAAVAAAETATPTAAAETATPTAAATATKVSDEPPISNGTPSDPVSVKTPSNLAISEVTNNSFKASWDAPTNTVGKITQYSVLVKENGVAKDTYYTAETNYVITGLSSNNAYTVEVRAFAVSASGLKQATSNQAISKTIVTSIPNAGGIPTEAAVDQAEVERIVGSVSDYYRFVGSAGSLDRVKQAKSKFDGRSDLTDAEQAELVAGFPEGFRYFDTSSSLNITNAYNQLFARTTQSDRKPGATVVVNPIAVTIKGNSATVNSSAIKVSLNGEIHSATETPYFELGEIHLVKTQDGSWDIIAETPRQSIP